MNSMMCLRSALTQKEVLDKYGIPPAAAQEFLSRIEPSFGSGESARYFESDVDQQIDQGRLSSNRPPMDLPKSSLKKKEEDLEMVSMEEGSLDRIANGLERLIEALAPKAPPTAIQMLTPQEASKQMRCNVQTVMKWCRQGKMGVKSGSKWLIDPKDVDRYQRGILLTKGRKVVPE